MYFKEMLPFFTRNDLADIKDCPKTEINVKNRKKFSPFSSGHHVKVKMRFNIFTLTLIFFFLISTTFIQPVQNFWVILMQNGQNDVLLTKIYKGYRTRYNYHDIWL